MSVCMHDGDEDGTRKGVGVGCWERRQLGKCADANSNLVVGGLWLQMREEDGFGTHTSM